MGSHFQTIMTLHSFLFPSQARLHFPVLPHFVLIFPDAHSGCQCSLSLTSLPSLCWIIQSKATGQGQWLWRGGAAAQSRLTEIERSGKDTPCAQRGGGALVLEPVNGEEDIHLRRWCLFMNQKMGLQMKLPWHEGEHWSVWASEDEEDLGMGKPALEFGISPTLQSRIRTADSGSEESLYFKFDLFCNIFTWKKAERFKVVSSLSTINVKGAELSQEGKIAMAQSPSEGPISEYHHVALLMMFYHNNHNSI